MSRPVIDLSGRRYDNWLVIERVGLQVPATWLCRCDCGNVVEVSSQSLKSRQSRRCKKCGLKRLKESFLGGIWINDGVSDRRLPKGAEIPSGWTKGRLFCATRGVKLPQLAGENSPRRRALEKEYGFKLVSSDNLWLHIAYNIEQRCRKQDKIPFGFINAQELANYLIEIAPPVCPVFGIPFEKKGSFNHKSPSVDRKTPELGYVRGNLQIISMKANIMKANASEEDLVKFAKWVLSNK